MVSTSPNNEHTSYDMQSTSASRLVTQTSDGAVIHEDANYEIQSSSIEFTITVLDTNEVDALFDTSVKLSKEEKDDINKK